MPKRFQEEKREEWRHIVKEWEADDSKVSINRWCQQRGVNYNAFLYWKERFRTTPISNIDRASFQELKQPVAAAELTLEYQQIRIQLTPNFDPTTLIKCLRAMKEAVC